MAYLDNQTITVDAILTKKGRELLAKGEGFKITKFALADDEVDYELWTPDHPLGSDYYGAPIENLPLLEPVPDETQSMRYKLISLAKSTTKMPVLEVQPSEITLEQPGSTAVITPQTNYRGGSTGGTSYTAILHDSKAAKLTVVKRAQGSATVPVFLRDEEERSSVTAIGVSFQVEAKRQTFSDLSTTVTIIDNETGASDTIPLTVKKDPNV